MLSGMNFNVISQSHFIIFLITCTFKLSQGSSVYLSDSIVVVVPNVFLFLELYTFKCLISSRLNWLSRLMILKGPEGPFQWTYGTVITWTLQWARLYSIDALNGGRMRIFSPGSTVVGIHGDKFFLGHLTLSDPRRIKALILFLQFWSNLSFRPETYSTQVHKCFAWQ